MLRARAGRGVPCRGAVYLGHIDQEICAFEANGPEPGRGEATLDRSIQLKGRSGTCWAARVD